MNSQFDTFLQVCLEAQDLSELKRILSKRLKKLSALIKQFNRSRDDQIIYKILEAEKNDFESFCKEYKHKFNEDMQIARDEILLKLQKIFPYS